MSKSIIGKSILVQVDSDSEDTVVGEQIIVTTSKQTITPDLKINYLVYDMDQVIGTFARVEFTDNVKRYRWFYDPAKGKIVFEFYYEEKSDESKSPNCKST